MLRKIKKALYFPLAYYFRFFAQIQLALWQPTIIVITGSSGKTTMLHLIESQLGKRAKYSHLANSSYGIPFDILDLHRRSFKIFEWPLIFLKAPLQAFKKPFSQKLYIVEADCDRVFEGQFLASFLKPEVTLWLDVSRTHTMNFDSYAKSQKRSVEEVVAFEFGYFAQFTQKLTLVNGDDTLIKSQLHRVKSEVKIVSQKDLQDYVLSKDKTIFKIDGKTFKFNYLLPEETFTSVAMCLELLKYLGVEVDTDFPNFSLPPGRSSLFAGVKNTVILDSSYNINFSSMQAVLRMYEKLKVDNKWAVLSDMTELGEEEAEEHQKLAQVIASINLDKVILMGPRMIEYTYPKLKERKGKNTELVTFEKPKEVLDYLVENLSGGETILFKGARFLEGIIEHLLADKSDASKLCRREKVWQERRRAWGL